MFYPEDFEPRVDALARELLRVCVAHTDAVDHRTGSNIRVAAVTRVLAAIVLDHSAGRVDFAQAMLAEAPWPNALTIAVADGLCACLNAVNRYRKGPT